MLLISSFLYVSNSMNSVYKKCVQIQKSKVSFSGWKKKIEIINLFSIYYVDFS